MNLITLLVGLCLSSVIQLDLCHSSVIQLDLCHLSVIQLDLCHSSVIQLDLCHSSVIHILCAVACCKCCLLQALGYGPPELATCGRDGCVRVWDVRQEDAPVAAFQPADSSNVRSVAAAAAPTTAARHGHSLIVVGCLVLTVASSSIQLRLLVFAESLAAAAAAAVPGTAGVWPWATHSMMPSAACWLGTTMETSRCLISR
jgi:hypothetical protein